MNSKLQIALAALVGVALGVAGMQGLQAQAKPKAYQITELDVIDAAALKVFGSLVTDAQKAAGGRNLRTVNGKVVAVVGDAPKHIAITEWDSLDQAVAWLNGKTEKDLSPQRDKAIKINRQYASKPQIRLLPAARAATRCPDMALSGHRLVRCTCLLLTQSGHSA